MNSLLRAALGFLTLGTSHLALAGTFHCTWNFEDFTQSPLATRQVTIQTIARYGVNTNTPAIITGDLRSYKTSTNTSLTVSNLVNGRSYRVMFYGPLTPWGTNNVTVITNSFDASVTGLVNAVDYLGAPLATDGATVAYSQAGADARFHNVSGDTSTNATFRGTVTMPATGVEGFVWVATNAAGAGFWAVPAGRGTNNTFYEELQSSRVGVTRSLVIRNTSTNLFFYLPNTNGIVRSLFYTSPNFGSEGSWGVRTNLELRVYTDFGAIADFNAPDTNYLTCRIPLATWLGSRWFNHMSPHNYPFAPTIPTYMLNNHTLYWDINDTWAYNDFDSVGSGNINFFEFCLRLPMPFTNGMFVQFWKLDTNEPFTNVFTFHHTLYEVGHLPVGLRGVRLRTQYTSGTYPAGSAGIPIATNISGAGELLAICADFHTPSNHVNTASVLENQWSYTVDGVAGDLTTGGEDLFMNGYYFSMTGPRVFANRGTTLLRTHPFYVSAYRQFGAADGIRWRSSAHWWYPWGGPTGNNSVHTRANLLSFYYNQ